MIAAQNGKLNLMSMFFEKSLVSVNHRCYGGKTALFYACDSELGENVDVVSFLLEQNATVNLKMDGTSCLIRACERGLRDIVYKLLEKGADYNQTKEKSGKSFSLLS